MTQLRVLRVSTTDTNKAAAILHHLEDVSADRRTVATIEDGKTIVVTITERDMPAIQQVLALWHRWIVSIT